MVASFRASGLKAGEVFSKLLENIEFLSAKNLKMPPVTSILQEKNVQKLYKKYLPSMFSKLKKKVYI
jgi:hypothetical protein